MALKVEHDKQEDIPEQFQELYSEKDGKWVLTGIAGVRTQADVDAVQASLGKERNDHKEAKAALGNWSKLGKDHEEVQTMLDKIPELEALAEGNVDEAKIEKIVETRVKGRLTPLERKVEAITGERDELVGKVTSFESKERNRTIADSIREQATSMKVIPSAVEDIIMIGQNQLEINDVGKIVTKELDGVIPGLDVENWLGEQREKKSHWWPDSSGGGAGGSGGGAGGSGGKNPWSKEHWNKTAQGAIVVEKGKEYAEKLAKQAGSELTAVRPPSK